MRFTTHTLLAAQSPSSFKDPPRSNKTNPSSSLCTSSSFSPAASTATSLCLLHEPTTNSEPPCPRQELIIPFSDNIPPVVGNSQGYFRSNKPERSIRSYSTSLSHNSPSQPRRQPRRLFSLRQPRLLYHQILPFSAGRRSDNNSPFTPLT